MWNALVSMAHSKCSIAVREHLGDYQLMCHTPVALDVTAATFGTEGCRLVLGLSLELVSIGMSSSESNTFYLHGS